MDDGAFIGGALLGGGGVLMNGLVLRSLLRHRATLATQQPDAARLVGLVLCGAAALGGGFAGAAASHAGAGAPHAGLVVLACGEFATLALLFSATALLAFAKYFRIRFDRRLPQTVVNVVVSAGLLAIVFFVAAFVPTTSEGGARWTFSPLPIPTVFPQINAQTTLFLLALLYFFACAIAVGVFYENSYFVILSIYQTDSDVESVLTFSSRPPSTINSDTTSTRQSELPLEDSPLKIQMNSLMRYVAMSIGFMIFYGPGIIFILVSIFKKDLIDNLWLQFFARWITPLGPIFTPVFAVFCFDELRHVFFEDWTRNARKSATSIDPPSSSSTIQEESSRTRTGNENPLQDVVTIKA